MGRRAALPLFLSVKNLTKIPVTIPKHHSRLRMTAVASAIKAGHNPGS